MVMPVFGKLDIVRDIPCDFKEFERIMAWQLDLQPHMLTYSYIVPLAFNMDIARHDFCTVREITLSNGKLYGSHH